MKINQTFQKTKTVFKISAFSASLLVGIALAATTAKKSVKPLPPHVHGEAALHFVGDADKKQIEVKMEIPGMNLFGFEHPATNASEKKIVDAGMALLKDPSKIFVFNGGDCKVSNSKIHQGQDEDGGSDFDVEYSYTCADLTAVKNLDAAPGFKNMKNQGTVHAEGLWGSDAKKEDLVPKSSTLSLK